MDKPGIKAKVRAAYEDAKQYPYFMDRFKPAIQEVIDSYIPSSVTHPWHVEKDLNYLREISKARGYKAKDFLKLVVNYVEMLIKAYEKGTDTIDIQVQPDLFPDDKQN